MFWVEDDIFFKDREHAGRELGELLEPKYKYQNPLILGVPRGGVEVAYYVAQQLNAELDLVISKKLPFPGHREYGFGSIAEDFSIYISRQGSYNLPQKVINQIVEEQIQEIKSRVQKYRHGRPLPNLKGRTVIIVDDGIATGVTLVPIIKLCQKKHAAKIVIAAPVSGNTFDEHLYEADAIEVVVKPQPFHAVGQVYETFGDFDDEQLKKLLQQAEERAKSN
jgi:predicted phosphoribosyltransferase